jgi:hypothetical protein
MKASVALVFPDLDSNSCERFVIISLGPRRSLCGALDQSLGRCFAANQSCVSPSPTMANGAQ